MYTCIYMYMYMYMCMHTYSVCYSYTIEWCIGYTRVVSLREGTRAEPEWST